MDEMITQWGEYTLTGRALLAAGVLVVMVAVITYLLLGVIFPYLRSYWKMSGGQYSRLVRNTIFLMVLLLFGGLLWALNWSLPFVRSDYFYLSWNTLIWALVLVLLARMMDIMLNRWFVISQERQKQLQSKKSIEYIQDAKPKRTVQWAVYLLVTIALLQQLQWDITLIRLQAGRVEVHASDIITVILIFVLARLGAWIMTSVIMYPYYKGKNVDLGTQYAVNQLITYFLFVIAFFIAIESLGLSLTVLWGSAAALLVGVGLGLQQTFNDLTSGIILLFDRAIEVGNVVDLKGTVGIVRKIGLRTSQIETRDNILIIVPNSKMIVDEVVNWSHFDDKARFKVTVGVAYGSDTEMVKSILLQVATDNVFVLEHPSPTVFFAGFGDSALQFELYFWSRNFMYIERVKSDIRYEVDKAFRENDIVIPFPQRDIWIRDGGTQASDTVTHE